MIAYANSKGITVWIHPWWSRKGLNQTRGRREGAPLVAVRHRTG